jgi:hypothetical protein
MAMSLRASQINNLVVDCFPRLFVARTNSHDVFVTWRCDGILQVTTNLGPAAFWRDIPTTSNTFTTNAIGALFFRLR